MNKDTNTLAVVCSCGRRLTVPRRLAGSRVKCVGCNRALAIPEEAPKRKAIVHKTSSSKAPPLPTDQKSAESRDEEESQRFVGITAGIIAGVLCALLILCFLLWFQPWNHGGASVAGEASTEIGGNSLEGDESGADDGTPERSMAAEDSSAEEENNASSAKPLADAEVTDDESQVVVDEVVGGSESPTETQAPTAEGGSAEEGEDIEELAQQPSQGGTRKTIAGLTESTLAGVKVYGDIALVCDISGSMQADLPNLVKELREKFPAETPLIFVPGCGFHPPTGDKPQKGSSYMSMAHMGGLWGRRGGPLSLLNDPNVYSCSNTIDAIIFAAKKLDADTVMFNNDLQDGGSVRAIDALQRVHEETEFRLSGRSLEHDAPQALLDFIKKTGGDFVVDPIYRRKNSAVRWAGARR